MFKNSTATTPISLKHVVSYPSHSERKIEIKRRKEINERYGDRMRGDRRGEREGTVGREREGEDGERKD